jgi:hypothetical protein
MTSNEPFEAPNVGEVPPEDFNLDDLGDLEVSPKVVEMARKRIREELRKNWPNATGEEIEVAASRMERIQLRTLTSGVINYRVAYQVGAQVAERLGQRLHLESE